MNRYVLFFVVFFLVNTTLFAQESEEAAEALMHHVTDNRVWQPIPVLPGISLPQVSIGGVAIPLTQHVLMLWIVALFMIITMIAAFRKRHLVPTRLGSVIEPLVFFVRDSLVYPAMGPELGARWLPFFITLFFFLLLSNLLGLVPLFPTVTGNLSVTAALAVMIFLGVVIEGMKRNGFIGFFKNMIPEGIPAVISIFLLGIEILGLFIRNAVLAIRLFANMIAGHFVIVSLLLLIIIVNPFAGVVSVPLALFIDLLEVLVAIIQAVVFTTLSALFIGMACEHH